MSEEKLKTTRLQLVRRQPVDIEFIDLAYSVPTSRTSSKLLLRNVSGYFRSGELTAILGPSGAGKSTLLNVLAGYNPVSDGSGSILVNGEPREMKTFKKLSRYIMQEDVHQSSLTVLESLRTSADLKLGSAYPLNQKLDQINEILDLLRLSNAKDTLTSRLSGGEKKRLSIALELVNNPPVLFLDEPTTGLDDLSSSQCVHLLKNLARGGRTVICSIHTPSARLFALFDNVYLVSEGQCVFQGRSEDIVPFLAQFGLHCPVTYNPADFIIEVSSNEYGNYQEKMVSAVNNGRVHRWTETEKKKILMRQDSRPNEVKAMPDYGCGTWEQFVILLCRMFTQTLRDRNMFLLKTVMHIAIGLIVGLLFLNFGHDGSKTLFNFGFCFISMIVMLYIPMLPAILWFPQEVQSVKREYFNQWYRLSAYYFALNISRLPFQLIQGSLYVAIVYTMTDQPLEWERFLKFSIILGLICLVSEAFGMAISSRLNIVNGIFVGPAFSVPFMLLAVYGMGSTLSTIPLWIRLSMKLSFLRFGLEGLVMAIYGGKRENMPCPSSEIYCPMRMPRQLIKDVGMENANYWVAVGALVGYFFLFKIICYIILRHRLKRSRATGLLFIVGRFIKTHFNIKH